MPMIGLLATCERYFADLSQGGLENHCKLVFRDKQKEINKHNCLLFCKAMYIYR